MAASEPRPTGGLSAQEARNIAVRALGLGADSTWRTASDVLRGLGAVQLDTISVLARSHELVAYSRLGAVPRPEVEAAYWATPPVAFEYNSHANCIMPIEAWPYFSFRRRRSRERSISWFTVPNKAVDEARARVRERPVTASDLGGAREGDGGWWSWSASKRAIELLYYRGEVICTTRQGWKRVYDLPQRALPANLLDHEPDDEECFRYLVDVSARALGVGTRRDIIEYFRLTTRSGNLRETTVLVDRCIQDSGFIAVEVEGWKEIGYVHPDAMSGAASSVSRTTLISPFDGLVWDRKRAQRLFDFTFSLEAYVPRDKRVHGYFVMPLLAGNRLVGRVDPKRAGKTLIARKVFLEDPEAAPAMAAALREAASWVGCDAVAVEHCSPAGALDGLV